MISISATSKKMPKKAQKPGCTPLYTEQKVIARVRALYQKKHSYRAILREDYPSSHLNHGNIQRIVKNGHLPTDPLKRLDLGLPALAPAPVCLKCGEVHTAKRCPKTQKPRAPRSPWLNESEVDERLEYIKRNYEH